MSLSTTRTVFGCSLQRDLLRPYAVALETPNDPGARGKVVDTAVSAGFGSPYPVQIGIGGDAVDAVVSSSIGDDGRRVERRQERCARPAQGFDETASEAMGNQPVENVDAEIWLREVASRIEGRDARHPVHELAGLTDEKP